MPISVDEVNKSTEQTCFSTLASKLGLTPKKLIQETKIIAFQDPADHFDVDKDGDLQIKDFKEQGRKRRAIKKIKQKKVVTRSKDGEEIYTTTTTEVEFHSKDTAIGFGMAIHGMAKPKKHEVAGKDGGPIDVAIRKAVGKELIDEVDGATRGLPNRGGGDKPAP